MTHTHTYTVAKHYFSAHIPIVVEARNPKDAKKAAERYAKMIADSIPRLIDGDAQTCARITKRDVYVESLDKPEKLKPIPLALFSADLCDKDGSVLRSNVDVELWKIRDGEALFRQPLRSNVLYREIASGKRTAWHKAHYAGYAHGGMTLKLRQGHVAQRRKPAKLTLDKKAFLGAAPGFPTKKK